MENLGVPHAVILFDDVSQKKMFLHAFFNMFLAIWGEKNCFRNSCFKVFAENKFVLYWFGATNIGLLRFRCGKLSFRLHDILFSVICGRSPAPLPL